MKTGDRVRTYSSVKKRNIHGEISVLDLMPQELIFLESTTLENEEFATVQDAGGQVWLVDPCALFPCKPAIPSGEIEKTPHGNTFTLEEIKPLLASLALIEDHECNGCACQCGNRSQCHPRIAEECLTAWIEKYGKDSMP